MYNFTFEYEADGPKKPDFGFVENIHGIDVRYVLSHMRLILYHASGIVVMIVVYLY